MSCPATKDTGKLSILSTHRSTGWTTLREVIDLVREVRPWIDDALPKLSPRALAAVEIQQALAVLYMGEDELREVELENRLTDRGRHPTERAVLEALAGAERPLRQSEVHARLGLPEDNKPTPSRVGQILRELYDHGFTRRQLARARGRADVAHYSLAPRGWSLCGQVDIDREHTPKRRRQNQANTASRSGRLEAQEILEEVLDSGKDQLGRASLGRPVGARQTETLGDRGGGSGAAGSKAEK